MGAHGVRLAAANGAGGGYPVMDWVLLLGASALTCLLFAAVFRAAAHARVQPRGTQQAGFTLTKGAGWLQTIGLVLAAVALLVLLWTLVLRLLAVT